VVLYKSKLLRFIKIPSTGRLNKAQVQDDFYGNVGTLGQP